MPRILVVDDHAAFRRRVVQDIAKSFPGVDVDEAEDGRKALAMVEMQRYAIVLLDLSMPRQGGLEALGEMSRRRIGVPVLILSIHPEEEYAVRSFRAGASGYLRKDRAAEELAEAIRTVMAGGRYPGSVPAAGAGVRRDREGDDAFEDPSGSG